MTAVVGFPLGTIYDISGITQSKPGTVTLTAVALPNSFAISTGMTITFSNIVGMYELNRKRYIIGNFNPMAMTFDLYTNQGFPVDTSGFNAYVSGGEINIISYPPPAGEPPGLMYNNQ